MTLPSPAPPRHAGASGATLSFRLVSASTSIGSQKKDLPPQKKKREKGPLARLCGAHSIVVPLDRRLSCGFVRVHTRLVSTIEI